MSTAPLGHGSVLHVIEALRSGAEQGYWRRLDSAFASFMLDLDPEASAMVLMAAALLAHMEGQGHSCLDIDDLRTDPDGLATATPTSAPQWRRAMQGLPTAPDAWLGALQRSPLVWVDATAGDGRLDDHQQPLVLRGRRLYLRRYWRHEQQVALQVQARSSMRSAPVDSAAARQVLDRLFPATQSGATGFDPDRVARSPISDAVGQQGVGRIEWAVDWQKVACALALRAGLTIITGGPGTGKTHTAARLLALLYALNPASQRLRVGLCAPTGKAATRLKQAMSDALLTLHDGLVARESMADLHTAVSNTRTLHSLLGARPDTRQSRFSAAQPLALDVLIVDEASMIPLEMMALLLDSLPSQARLVLLGDRHQLASVEAGAVFGELCAGAIQGRFSAATVSYLAAASGQVLPASTSNALGSSLAQQTVTLRDSFRFGGAIERLAHAVNDGDGSTASALLRAGGAGALQWLRARRSAQAVSLCLHGRSGAQLGHIDFAGVLMRRPEAPQMTAFESWVVELTKAFDRFRVLCAVREGDWGVLALNRAIEQAVLAECGLRKTGDWYEGRPVIVTRNDASTGLFNGDVGIALHPPAAVHPDRVAPQVQGMRVYFSNGTVLRSVAASRLVDVETAFAMTVHKAQGSEFEHCVLVLPAEPSLVLTRELVYTGITRARGAFTLVTGRDSALTDAVSSMVRRGSGLPDLLAEGSHQPGSAS